MTDELFPGMPDADDSAAPDSAAPEPASPSEADAAADAAELGSIAAGFAATFAADAAAPVSETPQPSDEPVPGATEEAPHAGAGTIHYSAAQAARARQVLTRLQALRRAVRFYPLEHPSVADNVELFAETVETFHKEGVELQLAFFDGEILLGDQLLTEESVLFDQLVNDLITLGVGSLVFRRGVDAGEFARAAKIITAEPTDVEAAGGVVRMAMDSHIPHVVIGVVKAAEYGLQGATADERSYHAFANAVELVEEIDESIRQERRVNPGRVRGVVRSLVDGVLSNRYSMLQLTGLKNFDEYTFYHSANVAILSIALGSMITHDERFLSSLGTGALLHDIGKLSVGLDILNKPGQLSPEEWDAMRSHPTVGAQMIGLMPGLDKSSIVTILEHHMRWDGAGYPAPAPGGHRQHLTSRIVAVADTYDAMTSHRSYSAARVQDEAMALLVQCGGTSLDPVLVRLFVNLLGMYPPRTVVRLSSGEVGIVLMPAEGEPERPVVRIVSSPNGELIEPVDVELANRPDLSVKECLDPRLLNVDVDDYV